MSAITVICDAYLTYIGSQYEAMFSNRHLPHILNPLENCPILHWNPLLPQPIARRKPFPFNLPSHQTVSIIVFIPLPCCLVPPFCIPSGYHCKSSASAAPNNRNNISFRGLLLVQSNLAISLCLELILLTESGWQRIVPERVLHWRILRMETAFGKRIRQDSIAGRLL